MRGGRRSILTPSGGLLHAVVMSQALRDHFLALTPCNTVRSLAVQSGIEPSTLHRQLEAEMTKPTIIATICRRFGLPLLPAFMAAGYVEPEELDEMAASARLALVSDVELAGELLRRASVRAVEAPGGLYPGSALRVVE